MEHGVMATRWTLNPIIIVRVWMFQLLEYSSIGRSDDC